MKSPLRRLALPCVLILFGALVIELVLQAICWKSSIVNAYMSPPSPADDEPPRVSHPVLQTAPNPRFPGHDFRGYRNVGLQKHFDIVALGDSQTYGMGSEMWDAWPQQLEFISGRSVYNMSYGGWTAVHFSYLMDEVFALCPDTVIFGLYATRFFGAYRQLYYRGNGLRFSHHQDDPLQFLVDRGVVEPVSTTRQRIYALDSRATGMSHAESDTSYATFEPEPYAPKVPPVPYAWRRCKLVRIRSAIDRYLLHSSRPWYRRVYRKTGRIPLPMPMTIQGVSVRKPKPIPELEGSLVDFFSERINIKRISDPTKRMFGMDLRDVRIAEGLRVTMEVLKEMAEQCRKRGIRFVVLWIPTKEETMYNWLVENYEHDLPDVFHQLHACESLLRYATIAYLQDHSMDVVDSLPRLQRCYENNVVPYRFDRDGHPNRIGYRAIAEAVNQGRQIEPNTHRFIQGMDNLVALAFPQQHAGAVCTNQVLVNAILRDWTRPPTAEAVRPYTAALVGNTYEVVDVRRGQMDLGMIQVYHWAVRDGEVVLVPRRTETAEPLLLEPMELHVELADVFTVDDTEHGFDLPRYFCVGR